MRFRTLGLAMAGSAVVLSILAAPTLAISSATRIIVAQGIPGTSVDVCRGGTVLKSGLGYGGQMAKTMSTGPVVLRFRKHSSTACHGTLLASKSVTLSAGENVTLVPRVLSGKYSVLAFVNDLTGTSPTGGTIVFRHAAAFANVDLWLGGPYSAIQNIPRGSVLAPNVTTGGVVPVWVSAHGGYAPLMSPRVIKVVAWHAYQMIAVGTSSSNYRFIVVDQLAGL